MPKISDSSPSLEQKQAEADRRLAQIAAWALEVREIEHEITMQLQYGRISFEEAAQWAERAGRGRSVQVRGRLAYTAALWRSRGPTTWGGQTLDRNAEIPKASDDFKALYGKLTDAQAQA